MSRPTNLSIAQREALLRQTASIYSDNFFTECHYTASSVIVQSIFSSLTDWLSFYFIGEAIVFFILSLPVLFFFQANGKQRKMQKVYGKSRLNLIFLMYQCSFALILCPLLSIVIKRGSPCVEGSYSTLLHFGRPYEEPSSEIAVAAIFSFFIFSATSEESTFLDLDSQGKIKSFIINMVDKSFFKVSAVLILSLFYACDIIDGKASIIQGLFSICVGFCIVSFVSNSSFIISLSCSAILAVLGVIAIILTDPPTILPIIYIDLRRSLVEAIGLQLYSAFLLIQFIRSRSGLSFKSKFSSFLEEKEVVSNAGCAVFGELEVGSQADSDMKLVLLSDLRDSGIGTLIHILAAVMQEFIVSVPDATA